MTAIPQRIHLSRAKGFDLQAASLALNGLPAVNVARPTPWGNPFIVGQHGSRDRCVELFQRTVAGHIALLGGHVIAEQHRLRDQIRDRLTDLKGKNLACWCRLDGKPCHADVLLKLAARLP